MEPKWLNWARQLAAISQSGLTYSDNQYEIERYQAIRDVAAEMMAAGSDMEKVRFAELFLRQTGYATPKVDVRGAAFRDDTILLVKESVDGLWTLPGGFADVGDSPSEAVERELLEESGFQSRATKLCAVYDRNKHPHKPSFPFHLYKMFFLCEITGGEPKTSHETDAVEFFAESEIPPLSQGRVLPQQIEQMFQYYRDPSIPTDFD
jgi:ADP-ribose pyrophosphatase YjhB (NUDIX family)